MSAALDILLSSIVQQKLKRMIFVGFMQKYMPNMVKQTICVSLIWYLKLKSTKPVQLKKLEIKVIKVRIKKFI